MSKRVGALAQKKSLAARLEGWELGAVVVLIVGIVTAVMVPRTAIPEALPAPHLTRDELEGVRSRNAALADRALSEELPAPVRFIGAQLRVLGRAEWSDDAPGISDTLEKIQRAARVAMATHAEEVAALRAYHARLFVDAYCAYLRTGERSDDLKELGGGALDEFAKNGWITSASSAPRDVDVILAAMFKKRFMTLVAPRHPALALDPVEERALLGYQLEHPPNANLAATGIEQRAAGGEYLLRRIDELSALEPSYPTLYARGIVLFRMQQFEASATSFDAYVQQVGNGPYRVRAVNYMKAAVEHTEGSPDLE